MRIFLDDTTCDLQADSVGQAIAEASALASSNGRMIVEVIVNGERWTQQQLLSPDVITAEAEEVRFTSADPAELLSQTFTESARVLGEANLLQQHAAELLQSDEIEAAMKHLEKAVGLWSSVQQAVSMGMEIAELTMESPIPGLHRRDAATQPATIQSMTDELNQQLRGVGAALEARDAVALADILLYEFPEVVTRWQAMLNQMDAMVRGKSNS